MRRRGWTDSELVRLRSLYPWMPTHQVARILGRSASGVFQTAYRLGLRKALAYLAQLPHLSGANEASACRRFAPGHRTWNAGLRGWDSGGRSHETRFRKGSLSGAAAANLVPVGTEVIDPDGYLKRKVADNRAVPSRRNWRFVHVLLWEEAHGPVPAGHAVVFRNGDKRDIRDENLELVTRAELMRRNTIYRYPAELVRTIKAAARLRRTIAKVQERAS